MESCKTEKRGLACIETESHECNIIQTFTHVMFGCCWRQIFEKRSTVVFIDKELNFPGFLQYMKYNYCKGDEVGIWQILF